MMELWKPEQQEFKKEELFAYIRSFGLQMGFVVQWNRKVG